MIGFDAVDFSYPEGARVLEGFSWKALPGETWTVVGPSGAGKSTFLGLAAGLLFPTAGKITVSGRELRRPRPETGLVLQDYGLLPWLTVRRNLALGSRIRRFYGPDGVHSPKDAVLDRRSESERTSYWISRLGLEQVADALPGEISGGQRQRTALGRTFLLEPDLLLLDEPFGSLDHAIRGDLQNLLTDLHRERPHTRIFVTHSLEEAAAMGEKILVLRDVGFKILEAGSEPGAGEDGDLLAKLRLEAQNWGGQR